MGIRRSKWAVAVSASLILTAVPAWAQSDAERVAELEAKTAAMEQQIAALTAGLEKLQANDSQTLRSEVIAATQTAQRAEKSANEWKNTTSVSHLAGYAAAGYTDQDNGTSAFNIASFNPIFHFQYGDRILWESELEIEVPEDGGTNVALEYSAIDLIINDYLVFVAGKFLSPLGNFRQNLHPAWINKLPSAPPGFGHDGAAPIAEVGVELRGGMPFGSRSLVTYAGYVGNGPKLMAMDGELTGIDTEGFTDNEDDKLVVGGRISVLPIPELVLGVSGAVGDATVTENDELAFADDPTRSYEVLGSDLSYRWNRLQLLAEYIQQKVDDDSSSVAPDGGKWKTWYVQSAYPIAQTRWEGVLRYTDFNSPDTDESQKQWSLGLDYVLAPSAMIKFAYEFNDGLNGEPADDDRWLVQVTYGY